MKSELTIDEDGTKEWKLPNSDYHREDGPAVEFIDGSKHWYINGKGHREDGPAIVTNYGYNAWMINDKLHREDGPAIETANGGKAWYLNDVEYTEKEYRHKTRSVKLKKLL